jgi:hypothetical protein
LLPVPAVDQLFAAKVVPFSNPPSPADESKTWFEELLNEEDNKSTELPLQIVPELAVAVTEVGKGLTVTDTVAVVEQLLLAPPLLSEPVTV